ncbi:THO complex subunit 2 isoform X2 [Thrips palmi]|uniref:THO complex subunit 2 n=1 Tax=Thrips palmi TaxID=161013 RepID=A0A6P8Z9Z0_THRPL|nr:THO complex subunit 2 isoform X2 [Thrips palmi]
MANMEAIQGSMSTKRVGSAPGVPWARRRKLTFFSYMRRQQRLQRSGLFKLKRRSPNIKMAESKMSAEIWKSWDRNGKTEFLSKCAAVLESSDESPVFATGKHTSDLTRWTYELLTAALSGQVRKESALAGLEELSALHPDLPSLILDVFCILDAETCSSEVSEERLRFHFLLKESEKFLSDRLLKERGEIDTLQEVGTLKTKAFYTKFIKVKTKLYYKQRKFNLFREENEGYAKLIVELNQGLSGDPAVTLESIKSLIGCFNLDPNRVLDVMLESFECNPREHKYFVPLVKSYMPDSKILSDVLGFKFSLYQGPGAEKTPKSLYILTALMLQYKLITLEDLLVWLVPDDAAIFKDWETEMQDAREQIRKMNVVSVKDKDDKKDEPVEEKETPAEKYEGNQKFGLCEALMNLGAWSVIKDLCKKFPDHYLMEQPTISRAMCNLLHVIIDPLYKTECSLGPKIKGKPVPKPEIILATPQVFTFEELKDNVVSMFQLLGPYIYVDPVLLAKLIRICKSALSKLDLDGKKTLPTDAPMYYEVMTLLDESILPALSFMDGNCCIAEDIWNVLKLYPYTHRYLMYGRWKNDSYQYHAKLMVRRADAHKKIKSIMKRVSKENIKQIGRLIGKMTHSAPGFIFDYMLLQIQLYDNLIGPVVDSLKYLTSLSYDVLAYCLVECLTQADKERDRVKHDGTSISMWLQSLSSFCGAIFKKYNIELSGLLQYVANQLKSQRSLDLLILKEIVQKMAGIEAAEEMTAEQLDAMAGGEMLKAEAAYYSQVRNTKKSSTRLREALADQNLAVALCLLMAQQRYNVVYHETENSHLKLVGRLYDQAQDTLVQFGTFLGLTMSVEEYVNRLPPIDSLLSTYHIHTDVAFFLARPMFNHAINNKYEILRKSDPNGKKLTVVQKQQKYVEAAAAVMGPIVESVKPLHPLKIWEDVSPQFLITFWSLTMYDLHVPVEAYNKEIAKMKQLAVQALESKDMPSSKSKKEHERYIALQEKIQDEKKKQQEHVDRVLARLRHEKEAWFLSRSAKAAKNETITQFLQLCLFPRCIFTMPDAMYCAKFVHTIHSLKTANFSTLLCYDRLFCDITYSVTSCTENEANRYGRFLNSMLETVMRWHSDKAIFEKECANYPGFVTKYRVSNQFSEACNLVGYENYRHVCHKWHYKITKAMVVCLDSKDYVQIRNSLIILRNILPHFPVLIKLGHIIQKKLEKICEEEKSQRQDLFALAMSYIGLLKAKSSQMIPESSFHQVGDKQQRMDAAAASASKPSGGGGGGGSGGGGVGTPAGSADTKSINGDSKDKTTSAVREKRPILAPTPTKGPSQQNASSDSDLTARTIKDEKKKERDSHSHSREQHRERDRDREIEPKEKLMKKEKVKDREEEKWEDEWREKRKDERHREERFMDSEERHMYSERDRDRDRGRDREREREREKEKDRDNSHYSVADDRELSSVSNSSAGSAHRRSQEPIDADRDVKRRKTDASSSSKSDRKVAAQLDYLDEVTGAIGKERRERSSRTKKVAPDPDEKELRKERKLGRKRQDRVMEEPTMELKRRKDESSKLGHQNGDQVESHRDKHRFSREKSPYSRERSHERLEHVESREKHRRTVDSKRR